MSKREYSNSCLNQTICDQFIVPVQRQTRRFSPIQGLRNPNYLPVTKPSPRPLRLLCVPGGSKYEEFLKGYNDVQSLFSGQAGKNENPETGTSFPVFTAGYAAVAQRARGKLRTSTGVLSNRETGPQSRR